MKVGLFVTCLVDAWLPQIGQAAVEVLERLGVSVEVPPGQSCCGQLHINTGYPDLAVPLVRGHLQAFADYEAIVIGGGLSRREASEPPGQPAGPGAETIHIAEILASTL